MSPSAGAPAANDRDSLKVAAMDLAEAVACFANASDGTVVVGMKNGVSGTTAFVGIPRDLDTDRESGQVRELAMPARLLPARPA